MPWRWKNPLRDYLGNGDGAIPRSSIWMRRPAAWMETCKSLDTFSPVTKMELWTLGTMTRAWSGIRSVASKDLKDDEPSGLGSDTIISDQHFFNLLGQSLGSTQAFCSLHFC